MKCPRCQNELPDGSRFCPNCGWMMYTVHPIAEKAGKAVVGLVKAICYLFLMTGMQVLVGVVFVTSALMAEGVPTEYMAFLERTLELLLENQTMIMLVTNLLLILVLSLFFHLRRKNPMEETGIRPVPWKTVPLCALYGAALQIFVAVTLSILPIPAEYFEAVNNQYAPLIGQTNIVVEILAAAVLTGIVEEIIFRGLALSRLKRGMSRGTSIVISALLFGSIHGVPLAICYAAVLGVLFGLLTERYNSVLPSVFCHIFFNMTTFFLPHENPSVLLALYIISIAVLIVVSVLLFRKKRTEE